MSGSPPQAGPQASVESSAPDVAVPVSPFHDLPPWQGTILARYTRQSKLATLGTFLVCLLGVWLTVGGGAAKIYKPKPKTVVQAADTRFYDKEGSKEESAASESEKSEGRPVVVAHDGVAAPALNDIDDRSIKLAQAPDPGLSEDTAEGSLPRISEDGRQPWQVYARPFNTADRRPRIAFIIYDLGLSRVSTDAAITRLPANVTLSFDVQSPVSGAWCGRARQVGHEVIIQIPMEPFDYPRSDPGLNTLLTTLPMVDNLQRLQWGLRQGTGYVGITTLSGSRFTTETTKISPILQALHERGLMFVDARVGPHSAVMDLTHDMRMPAVAANVRIDQNFAPEAIDAAFAQLEQMARLTGSAVGMAPSVPIVLDKLEVWLKELSKHGIALAPVSAVQK